MRRGEAIVILKYWYLLLFIGTYLILSHEAGGWFACSPDDVIKKVPFTGITRY